MRTKDGGRARVKRRVVSHASCWTREKNEGERCAVWVSNGERVAWKMEEKKR